jgi:2',3'-cyclic-nucleotide 2'-phosphodiesterase / 3'-nucleotidase
VLAAPDGTREILAKWLQRRHRIDSGDLEPTSWKFAPLKTHGPIVFTAASGKQDVAHEACIENVRQLKDHGDGTATYAIGLSH